MASGSANNAWYSSAGVPEGTIWLIDTILRVNCEWLSLIFSSSTLELFILIKVIAIDYNVVMQYHNSYWQQLVLLQ